jgi:hypothetical protein
MTALECFSSLPDDLLMQGSGGDFAQRLHGRAWRLAQDLYDPAGWEQRPLDPELYQQRLVFYLRRRSWAEWYFGTVTPARQILLLHQDERSLALRLARQIQDEVRHHDAFASGSRQLGGEWRIESFPEPVNLTSMREAQQAAGSAGELAAANQLAGEVVLLIHGQPEGNVLRTLVPPSVQEMMEDIETDEPAHVDLGHALVSRYATGPAQRRAMALAQERFLTALGRQHVHELEQLGAARIRPVAGFAS